jgi:hypothetical protein
MGPAYVCVKALHRIGVSDYQDHDLGHSTTCDHTGRPAPRPATTPPPSPHDPRPHRQPSHTASRHTAVPAARALRVTLVTSTTTMISSTLKPTTQRSTSVNEPVWSLTAPSSNGASAASV